MKPLDRLGVKDDWAKVRLADEIRRIKLPWPKDHLSYGLCLSDYRRGRERHSPCGAR